MVVAMYELPCAHRVSNGSNRLTFEDVVNEKYFEQSTKLTHNSYEKSGLVILTYSLILLRKLSW